MRYCAFEEFIALGHKSLFLVEPDRLGLGMKIQPLHAAISGRLYEAS
jgi:hypothetical protein